MDISNFTSLPTDSLYKFMALSGLLLSAFFIVFTEILESKFRDRIFSLNKRFSNHKIKCKWFAKEVDDLNQEIRNIRNKIEANRNDKESNCKDEKHIEIEQEVSRLEAVQKLHIDKTIEIECITADLEIETISQYIKKDDEVFS